MTLIAPTLQAFFTDRLVQQRQASPRTIAAYRDALRLLLTFVHGRTGKLPAQLDWDDLDSTTVSAFLNHLETERNNGTRTRNVRLTAIRSLFSYAALRHPEHALLIQRVLAIPPKRFDKRMVTFLTTVEIDALIAAPDQARWEGRGASEKMHQSGVVIPNHGRRVMTDPCGLRGWWQVAAGGQRPGRRVAPPGGLVRGHGARHRG
jgi:site-specific recombinase XerD